MTRLAWEQVDDYVSRRLEAVLPMSAGSKLMLVVGSEGAHLSLRLPIAPEAQYELQNPFAELSFQRRMAEGKPVVEVTTSTRALFQTFCMFAAGVADLVDGEGRDPVDAVHDALKTFGELISRKRLLADSVRLGLFGEMHTVEGMLSRNGIETFESWLGPAGERHDFRIGMLEVEVKTTLQAQRIHTINGLSQLEPTEGKALYILSLQYQRSGQGAGRSLPELVSRVRHLLVGDLPRLDRLEKYLSQVGYRDADASFYDERLELRSAPVAVHVKEEVPRITPTTLSPALDAQKLSRISDVTYVLNLDGFGITYGTPAFKALLPMIQFDRHA